MDKKIKLTIDCKIDTSFWSYGNKKLDNKAIASIKRNIREGFRDNLSFIDIKIEKDEYDDCTDEAKIIIKGHRIYSSKK